MSPLPRIIHQIWIGPRERPAKWMESWPALNAGWEYRLWTNDNLPEMVNRRAFDDYGDCWHGKSDVLRYELLLRHGGVYIDADAECLRSIDDLLVEWPAERECFAVYENEIARPGLIANGILGTIPGSGLFRRLVDDLAGVQTARRAPAWQVTGPQFLTARARADATCWILPSWTFLPEHYSGQRYEGPERPFARHRWHTTTRAWPTA